MRTIRRFGRKADGIAVIFDLDGLLIDSETVFYGAYRSAVRKYAGKNLPESIMARFAGRPEVDDWDALRREYGLPLSAEGLLGYRAAYFRTAKPPRPMPYAKAVLSSLRRKGTPLAVASSSTRRYCRRFLRMTGLSRFFTVLACGDEVARKKPAPDVYLLAARKLGVRPKDCIAVEDSSSGIIAAKRAGMYAIAVPNKYTKSQDFSMADRVLPSLKQLPKGPVLGTYLFRD